MSTETQTLRVTGLLPESIPMAWPRVIEFLRPAVDRAGSVTSLDDVLRDLCLGRQQLFIVIDGDTVHGAIVAEIVPRTRVRVCAIPFIGGLGLDDWYDLAELEIGSWAKRHGCTVYECLVRKGLTKRLIAAGFAELGTVFRKDI